MLLLYLDMFRRDYEASERYGSCMGAVFESIYEYVYIYVYIHVRTCTQRAHIHIHTCIDGSIDRLIG